MSRRFSILLLASASLLFAVEPERDFSGKWILAQGARLSVPFDELLTIQQTETEIKCVSPAGSWTYALNGTERKVQIGGDTRNSLVKWEGAALLINTIVSGSHDYVVMDRWRLSRDHATLTITRQIVRGVKQEEGSMSYRRDRVDNPPPPPPTDPDPPSAPPALRPLRQADAPPAPPPPPAPSALIRRQDPLPSEILIPAGTHIPLSFRNTVDTRHAHEGDRIYLQTAFPVSRDGVIVIPKGSFVNGVITQVKQPGRSSKGELAIRFDLLQLPNGVQRDFRSRPAGGDEGKISSDTVGGADPRRVGQAAGNGAGIGVMTAAGHPGMGAGIGGAAAGIASVLFSQGAAANLPQGTTVDMVLDRDLRFRADELQ
jgi:type IV secretion system protein VirB10